MATRAYIFALILSIIILTIYSVSTVHTRSVAIVRPSLETFDRLQTAHLIKLQCSCSQLAISYNNMFDIPLPRYHQVSSSSNSNFGKCHWTANARWSAIYGMIVLDLVRYVQVHSSVKIGWRGSSISSFLINRKLLVSPKMIFVAPENGSSRVWCLYALSHKYWLTVQSTYVSQNSSLAVMHFLVSKVDLSTRWQ